MHTVKIPTYWVKIYLSGPIEVIEQTCRQECFEKGLCVTVDPTKFIYTGGEESGAVVGLINYPRFPDFPPSILERAKNLALRLLEATCQNSVLLMTPEETTWITTKDENYVP